MKLPKYKFAIALLPVRNKVPQSVSLLRLISSLALLILASCMPIQAPTTFEGLSSGLDNARQARIRATDAAFGGPTVDVYINGRPVVNGGKLLGNIGVAQPSGWVYVTPGVYRVTLVPHGQPLEQAEFEPVAVNAEAGHRYSVIEMGQNVLEMGPNKIKSIKPLVVDETAIIAASGAKPTDFVWIDTNNTLGATSMGEEVDGEMREPKVAYGEVNTVICGVDNPHDKAFVTEKPEIVLGEGDTVCEPSVNTSITYYGDLAGIYANEGSQGISELSVLDFLAAFSSHDVMGYDSYPLTFNILLAAIDKAGMHDLFAGSDPYFFLAPADAAFNSLPKEQLDALLNDPQALATQLKAHFIQGYFPAGSLSGAIYGHPDREVTNLLGQKLYLQDGAINGVEIGGTNYTVGNGNRVQFVGQLLPTK